MQGDLFVETGQQCILLLSRQYHQPSRSLPQAESVPLPVHQFSRAQQYCISSHHRISVITIISSASSIIRRRVLSASVRSSQLDVINCSEKRRRKT
ncbi:hypothetical protein RYX36_016310 [Vicia faba]